MSNCPIFPILKYLQDYQHFIQILLSSTIAQEFSRGLLLGYRLLRSMSQVRILSDHVKIYKRYHLLRVTALPLPLVPPGAAATRR